MDEVNHAAFVEKIRSLIDQTRSQTKAGKLRMLFDDIQQAQNYGVKLADILNGLNELGLGIQSLSAFKSELTRIKKEKGITGKRLTRFSAENAPVVLKKSGTDAVVVTKDNREAEIDLINKTSLPGFGKKPPRKPT
jgi:hypothetical protein